MGAKKEPTLLSPTRLLLLYLLSSSGWRYAHSLRSSFASSRPPTPSFPRGAIADDVVVRGQPVPLAATSHRRQRRRAIVAIVAIDGPSTSSSSSLYLAIGSIDVDPAPENDVVDDIENENDTDDDQVALSKIRRRLDEITKSLEDAKRREEEIKLDNNILAGKRDGTKIQTEEMIARLRRGYSDEIDVLSDRIEGAQDEMRESLTRTRSMISGIREDAAERASRLKMELIDLDARLSSMRQEANVASTIRNKIRKSVEDDVRTARVESNRNIEKSRSDMIEEKRRLKLEGWEIESRINRAEADAVSALEKLRDAREAEGAMMPLISEMREALSKAIGGASSRIAGLKGERKARASSFDASLARLGEEKGGVIESDRAKYDGEISDEDLKLDESIAYYDSLLTETEKRLRRIVDKTNQPVEDFGYDAIAEAELRMEALIREKDDAISFHEEGRISALKEAAESYTAIRDQYDAKYEDGLRDLEGQRSRSDRKIEREDRRRENRMSQLRGEMEELSLELSTLMKGEREAAKLDYQELKKTKDAALAKSASQYVGTMDQIRNVRSDLIFAQDELSRLRDASRENALKLNELEDERSSFRKQVKRTMAIAIARITRK